MTGYGRGSAASATREITVELASVNRRNLEVSASVPRDWPGADRLVTEAAQQRFHRGKIVATVHAQPTGEAAALPLDEAALAAELGQLREVAGRLGIPFEPGPEFLLKLIERQSASATATAWEDAHREAFESALNTALDALARMRADEGRALHADLTRRLDQLLAWEREIATLKDQTVPDYREALLARLKQTELEIDLEDERVLKEIALFADRCDISEELTRLESHLGQLTRTLGLDGPIGRKLDFICQEIFRELNTIGSKANNLDITRRVIDSKNELERVREQVQNIE